MNCNQLKSVGFYHYSDADFYAYKTNVKALATQGCPQDGVLSPLMWSLTMDDQLNLLGRCDIFVPAYADDAVVSLARKFVEVLSDRMQTVGRFI